MVLTDYEKIWKLAKYLPKVARSREVWSNDNKQKHLDKCRIKHKGIIYLYNSLGEESKKGIGHLITKLNEEFEENVQFYKNTYHPHLNLK